MAIAAGGQRIVPSVTRYAGIETVSRGSCRQSDSAAGADSARKERGIMSQQGLYDDAGLAGCVSCGAHPETPSTGILDCDGIGPKIEELGSGNKGRRHSGSIAAPVVLLLAQEEPRMLNARLCQVKSLLRLLEIGGDILMHDRCIGGKEPDRGEAHQDEE